MKRTKDEIEFELRNTLQKYEELFGSTLDPERMRSWIIEQAKEQEDNFFFSRLGHWRERDVNIALGVLNEGRVRPGRLDPEAEVRKTPDLPTTGGDGRSKPSDGPEVGYDEGALRKQRGRPRSEKTVLS